MQERAPREKRAPRGATIRRRLAENGEQENFPGARTNDGVLDMQKTVGNHSVSRTIALGGRPVQSGGATSLISRTTSPVIQRAGFAELMAFWRQQELGEAPKPQPTGKKQAPNLPPEPSPIPEDVKQDNPVLTEDTGPEEKSGAGGQGPGAGYAVPDRLRSEQDSLDEEEGKEAEGGGAGAYALPGRLRSEQDSLEEEKGPGHRYGLVYNQFGQQVDGGDQHSELSPDEASEAESGGGPALNLGGEEQKGGATKYNVVPAFHSGEESKSNGLLTIPSPVSATPTESSPMPIYHAPVPTGQVVGNKTQVKYLNTSEAQDEFELKVAGSVTQGGQPYDTSAMYSKFKGDGFGIYVMSQDGRFFSTSHKIGLFHHSSFLGGGAVAGAGEIQVAGGTIQYITNKSGHYWPGDKELTQTLHALQGASGFSSAKLGRLKPAGGLEDPYPDGAAGFLRDHPFGGGGSNKDAVKYDTKAINDTHKGEDQDSLSLVRGIIDSYVGMARQGRLKKFNKPNPDFGKTFEDIKLLVLAEFGWSEADTVTYQAVLENWNNTRPIGAVAGASLPALPSASVSSTWTPTDSSPVSMVDSNAGSVDPDGRDYNAELEELLKTNPSPDWSALGLENESFGWAIDVGMGKRSATAKDKVLLLKGEKTIDELK